MAYLGISGICDRQILGKYLLAGTLWHAMGLDRATFSGSSHAFRSPIIKKELGRFRLKLLLQCVRDEITARTRSAGLIRGFEAISLRVFEGRR